MNVYDQAHALARNLRLHPDVKAMQAAHAKVEADPKAKEMFENFVQKSMQLQMQELGGTPASDEQREELQKLSEVVFLHSDIRQLQELSTRVEKLIQDIYGIIVSAVQAKQE